MTKVTFRNSPFMTTDFRNIFNDMTRNINNTRTTHHSRVQSAVNIIETKQATEIHIALPGIDKENVDINLDRDILNITVNPIQLEVDDNNENIAMDQEGSKTAIKVEVPPVKYRRKEFDFSNFKRSFHLPETIDLKKINAQFKNGVLIVELLKKEEVVIEPQSIAID